VPQRPYRERGIKELDGYGAELVTLEFAYAVSVDPSHRTYLAAPGTASRARFEIADADADA
jgi:hypothetical protein